MPKDLIHLLRRDNDGRILRDPIAQESQVRGDVASEGDRRAAIDRRTTPDRGDGPPQRTEIRPGEYHGLKDPAKEETGDDDLSAMHHGCALDCISARLTLLRPVTTLQSTGAPAALPPPAAVRRGLSIVRQVLLASFAASLLAACTPPRLSASLPPASATPVPTSTATPAPAPSPTPTTPSCLRQPGEIIVEEYVDADLPRSIPYRVYLPPCYDRQSHAGYPLLVLLHGLLFTDSQWDDLGVDETADKLIRNGAIPPLVIVMPWERKGLDFESAVVDNLVPHIRSAYSGEGSRATTAIGGLSRGAGWALRIGLKHPEAFGAIGLHSPAVLPPDLYELDGWIDAARSADVLPGLWIDIAERDTSRTGALELAAALEDLDVPYAWSTAPGEHTAAYWSSRLEDYLRWYAALWSEP